MRVFVAGGTGAVGKRLVPLLVARGHHVTATTTYGSKAADLRAVGAEAVVVDGLDARSVGKAVEDAGPETVVHEMTALAGAQDVKHFDRWFAITNELRTKGTEHLLTAARDAGATRFVAQSYTGWTNSRTGRWVKSANDPLDPRPARAQTESLHAIKFLERAVLEAPLAGVVLRYGTLYGAGTGWSDPNVVEMVRKRKLPVVGKGTGVFSFVHVDDAAIATVAAVERGERGVYSIVDDEPAAVAEWLPCLAKAVDARPPRRVPAWLARPAIGQVGVQWMTEARGTSNRRAKRELGWRPLYPSWRQGFEHGLGTAPVDPAQVEAILDRSPLVGDFGASPRPSS